MVWYTVRPSKVSTRYFTTLEKATEWVEKYKKATGVALTIIERRNGNDTKKPEAYT